jgi:hypothetical protein
MGIFSIRHNTTFYFLHSKSGFTWVFKIKRTVFLNFQLFQQLRFIFFRNFQKFRKNLLKKFFLSFSVKKFLKNFVKNFLLVVNFTLFHVKKQYLVLFISWNSYILILFFSTFLKNRENTL